LIALIIIANVTCHTLANHMQKRRSCNERPEHKPTDRCDLQPCICSW